MQYLLYLGIIIGNTLKGIFKRMGCLLSVFLSELHKPGQILSCPQMPRTVTPPLPPPSHAHCTGANEDLKMLLLSLMCQMLFHVPGPEFQNPLFVPWFEFGESET